LRGEALKQNAGDVAKNDAMQSKIDDLRITTKEKHPVRPAAR